ncbi:MAG: hypothetical protein KH452_01075 [Clostridiales bacterium]|nr:hypothetical protein [Clostridiales bacterium]
MDVIAGKIELYHRLFLGCLTLSILCLILAAVLYFVLDMKTVLGYLTGRQKRKKVKEMEAANALSGRLLSRRVSPIQHVAQEMKDDMGIRQAVKPGARKVEHLIREPSSELGKTEEAVFFTAPEEGYSSAETAALDSRLVRRGRFQIERELILIHSEEVI